MSQGMDWENNENEATSTQPASQQVEEVGFEQRHRQAHVLQNFEIWSVLRPLC